MVVPSGFDQERMASSCEGPAAGAGCSETSAEVLVAGCALGAGLAVSGAGVAVGAGAVVTISRAGATVLGATTAGR